MKGQAKNMLPVNFQKNKWEKLNEQCNCGDDGNAGEHH
jgi:hypothetical protein